MEYKISMIIPVYNVEKFLRKAFESLKRQTIGFDNLQVLFADDCSADGSWELVQGYASAHPNVESVRLPENTGAAGAPRNAALELAKAKYFMCFDPDDELPDDACRLLYDAIEQTGVDFAFGYYCDTDSDGTKPREKNENYDVFEERRYNFPGDLPLFIQKSAAFWTKIYRVDLYREKKLSFPVGIPGQDMVFYMRYLFASKSAVYIDKCVYNYNLHPGSISFSKSKRFFLGINTCYKLCRDLFEEYGCIEQYDILTHDLLPELLNKMFVSELTDEEIEEVFSAFAWLWNRCEAAGLPYGSDCAEIIGAVFSSDKRPAVYKSLRKIVRYELELVDGIKRLEKELQKRDRILNHIAVKAVRFVFNLRVRQNRGKS